MNIISTRYQAGNLNNAVAMRSVNIASQNYSPVSRAKIDASLFGQLVLADSALMALQWDRDVYGFHKFSM